MATRRTIVGSTPIFFRMDFTSVDTNPAREKSLPSIWNWLFSRMDSAGGGVRSGMFARSGAWVSV